MKQLILAGLAVVLLALLATTRAAELPLAFQDPQAAAPTN